MSVLRMDTDQVEALAVGIKTAMDEIGEEASVALRQMPAVANAWMSASSDQYQKAMGDLSAQLLNLAAKGTELQRRLVAERAQWVAAAARLGQAGGVEAEAEQLARSRTGATDDARDWPVSDTIKGKKIEWGERQGAAFRSVADISVDDVRQGTLGDCWVLAGLGAIASKHPEQIANMLRANADGTYTVRFFDDSQPPKPVYVTVDGTHFPKNTSAFTSGDGNLWVPIIEKAYAKLKGGYGVLNEGGFEWNMMRAISGKAPLMTASDASSAGVLENNFIVNNVANPEGTWVPATKQQYIDRIVMNAESNMPMTVDAFIKQDGSGAVTLGAKSLGNALFGGFEGGHALIIEKVDRAANNVTLYNPWGSRITVSLDELFEKTSHVATLPSIPPSTFIDTLPPSTLA